MKKLIIFIIIGVFLASNVLADNTVNLYFFYGNGCSYCAAEEILLDELEVKYPTLNIEKYEVYQNSDNIKLFEQCSALSGTKIEGVPTTFIGEHVIVGYDNKEGKGAQIIAAIEECSSSICTDSMNTLTEHGPYYEAE